MLSREYGVDVIGRLPLDIVIRETTDSGNPVVASDAGHRAALAYLDLATEVVAHVNSLEESRVTAPNVTISDD